MPDWPFWLSLPAQLPQALRLRATALRLPPAEGETAGFIAGRDPPLRLLLLGDSIIAGIGVPRIEEAFAGRLATALACRSGRAVQWQAMGQGGLDARQMSGSLLPQLAALETGSFDLACLSVGVNDITGLTARRRWRAALEALHSGLRRHARRSVHLGLPPLDHFPLLPPGLQRSFGRRGRALDGIAAEVAAASDRLHLPMAALPDPDQFAPDGFHPNGEACAVWADDVAARILAAWPELLGADAWSEGQGD